MGSVWGINGKDHTPEQRTALQGKYDTLLKKQKEAAEVRRQKTIGPINTHTTLESNLNKAHITTEANRIIREVSSIVGQALSATPAPPAMDQGTMAEDTGAGLQGFLSQEELGLIEKAAPVVEEQKAEEEKPEEKPDGEAGGNH